MAQKPNYQLELLSANCDFRRRYYTNK